VRVFYKEWYIFDISMGKKVTSSHWIGVFPKNIGIQVSM